MGKEKSADVEMVDATVKVNGETGPVEEAPSKKETDMITLDGNIFNVVFLSCNVLFVNNILF